MNLYRIPKGKHSSGLHFSPLIKKRGFEIHAYFIHSMIDQDSINHDHINKLFGISFGHHNHNSFRIGWKSVSKNKIELFAYWYENSARMSQYLCDINVFDMNKIFVNCGKNETEVRINEVTFLIPTKIKRSCLGYKLFPYYGGTPTAPIDILINIKCLSVF